MRILDVYFSVHHQVEIEVPQTCSFVLHTTECILSEVSVIDAQGQPVYRQAAGAEAFQVAMEKYVEQSIIFGIEEIPLVPSALSSIIFHSIMLFDTPFQEPSEFCGGADNQCFHLSREGRARKHFEHQKRNHLCSSRASPGGRTQ